MGLLPAQGYIDPTHLNDTRHDGLRPTGNLTWRFDWPGLIRQLSQLPVPPEYVVLNAGQWDHDLAEPGVLDSIREVFRETGIRSIYRTTTAKRGQTNGTAFDRMHPHDKEYCAAMDACMNMSYTVDLPRKENYWDVRHFLANRNQKFIEDLFAVIDGLEATRT